MCVCVCVFMCLFLIYFVVMVTIRWISNKLNEVCPMVQDKNNNLVAGFEMGDLEEQGHVKFDILGIDLLSKIMEIKE